MFAAFCRLELGFDGGEESEFSAVLGIGGIGGHVGDYDGDVELKDVKGSSVRLSVRRL